MKKMIVFTLAAVLMTAAFFSGCKSAGNPAASIPEKSSSVTEGTELSSAEQTTPSSEAPTEETEPTKIDPAETIYAEPHYPPVMSMDELEAKLGFRYRLPDENEYSGTIVSMFDDSLGDSGGIVLEYRFDGFVVYAMKYADNGTDAYDGWAVEFVERGAEIINGIEVRFRGEAIIPRDKGMAFWKQNGYQYILNCTTAPGIDVMRILPLFIEVE